MSLKVAAASEGGGAEVGGAEDADDGCGDVNTADACIAVGCVAAAGVVSGDVDVGLAVVTTGASLFATSPGGEGEEEGRCSFCCCCCLLFAVAVLSFDGRMSTSLSSSPDVLTLIEGCAMVKRMKRRRTGKSISGNEIN